GCIPLLGYCLGQHMPHRMTRATKYVALSALTFALVCTALCQTFPAYLASIFSDDQAVVDTAVTQIHHIFAFTWLQSITFIAGAVTQVSRHIRANLVSNMAKPVCLLTFILLLPTFRGVSGVWEAYLVSDILSNSAGIAVFLKFFFTMRRGDLRLGEDITKDGGETVDEGEAEEDGEAVDV
ncbi:multi antimicrobial extrusion protein, partial [Kipferlia bialata]